MHLNNNKTQMLFIIIKNIKNNKSPTKKMGLEGVSIIMELFY